jgi:hypothetical protein
MQSRISNASPSLQRSAAPSHLRLIAPALLQHGPQRPVHQPRHKHIIVTRAALTLEVGAAAQTCIFEHRHETHEIHHLSAQQQGVQHHKCCKEKELR